MAWISIALRKQGLKASVNELTYEDIQLSRKVRSVHRHLAHEQSRINNDQAKELREIKSDYTKIRNKRPDDVKDDDYAQWQADYNEAQEDYQSRKQDIQDYYDDLKEEIEAEAQEEEDTLQDQITDTEAQRDAQSAELQSITDQIKTEIEGSAVKF